MKKRSNNNKLYRSIVSSVIISVVDYPLSVLITKSHMGIPYGTFKSSNMWGVLPQLTGSLISKSISYPIFEYVRNGSNNICVGLYSSIIASVITICFSNAFFVLSTGIQLYGTPMETFKYFNKNPILYTRGTLISLVGSLDKIIGYNIYNQLKNSGFDIMSAAFISKLVTGSLIYPYKTLRTRMRSGKYNSIIDTMHKPIYPGFILNLLRTVPATVLYYLLVDKYLSNI